MRLRAHWGSKQKKNDPLTTDDTIVEANTPEVETFPAYESTFPCVPIISAEPELAQQTLPVPASSSSNPRPKTLPLTPVMHALLAIIKDALISGQDIVLPGIGSFSIREHVARTGRNPRTGETIQIPARAKVHFKINNQLRHMLNQES